jgi:hypothetical protein
MSEAARIAAARTLLRAAGLTWADVEVAGHDRGIAVITRLDAASLPALAALAAEIKALGFRYLTIDITEAGS